MEDAVPFDKNVRIISLWLFISSQWTSFNMLCYPITFDNFIYPLSLYFRQWFSFVVAISFAEDETEVVRPVTERNAEIKYM